MMEHARPRLLRSHGYPLRLAHWALLALLLAAAGGVRAQQALPAEGAVSCQSAALPAAAADSMAAQPTPIGPGDSISINVYGQQDLTGTQTVAADGTIHVALIDKPLRVAGMSPAEAAGVIARALEDGKILLHPSVIIKMEKSVNDFVSVLGEVKNPNRYAIDSNTTLFDVLALAGGTTENASDVVCLSRRLQDGSVTQIPITLKSIEYDRSSAVRLSAGDLIFVAPAPHFTILGEVKAPHIYRLTSGMTIADALSAANGITDRGSMHRIVIRRPTGPHQFTTLHAKLSDPVEPDDLIIVRESIF